MFRAGTSVGRHCAMKWGRISDRGTNTAALGPTEGAGRSQGPTHDDASNVNQILYRYLEIYYF